MEIQHAFDHLSFNFGFMFGLIIQIEREAGCYFCCILSSNDDSKRGDWLGMIAYHILLLMYYVIGIFFSGPK